MMRLPGASFMWGFGFGTLVITTSMAILCAIVIAVIHSSTCPAPWKVADKVVLPSMASQGVEVKGIPKSAFDDMIQSKVAFVMICEPSGTYRIETVTNP
jgi:hypothetical protein